MKLVATTILVIGWIGPALCQPSTAQAPGTPDAVKNVAIGSFQWLKREDDNGIASFVISNNTDREIDSLELHCWAGDDRTRATKVMVWPSPGPIPPNATRQFSRVNVGPVGVSSSLTCEVADTK